MEATLAQVLAAIGEPLVEVAVAPAGLDVAVTGTAIVDPDDDPADHPGRLVLLIGARGRDAVRPLRAVARHGAVAVAVKTDGGPGDELRAAAMSAGVALLAVRADARWDHLEQLVHGVLDDGPAPDGDDAGDLFSLAQTIGLLTGGLVSIEDTASRVLAYSRSDDATSDDAGPDELRRLSILGWQGPADYLATLRGWGVYDRLRAGEEVVRIDEHAELGIRRRLAVGIHAGRRQLGTIWVQEGAAPLAERAEGVLVGAARVAAGHLARRRSQQSPGARWSRDVVVGLLDGRIGADLVAATFGLDPAVPTVVVAFAVRGPGAGSPAVGGPGSSTPDRWSGRRVPGAVARAAASRGQTGGSASGRPATGVAGPGSAVPGPAAPEPDHSTTGVAELGAAELSDLVAVHAATVRRGALTAPAGARVYAVLPGVPHDRVPTALTAMCADVAAAVRRRTGARVQAGIGSVATDLDGTAGSRTDADRVLDAMAPDADVAAIGDLRAEILLDHALDRLTDLHDPPAAALLRHDAEHGTELARSVLAHLDALGDVRTAARHLTVHPNTLRYRLRRASEVADLRLDDPSARLVHHLHLLAALRPRRRPPS